MIWSEQKLNKLPKKTGFRLRGLQMTRLETFTDAVFAFALTLLVISIGSIPKSYEELLLALKGTPAFAASFTSIVYLWLIHRKWSRRYGLEDMISILITFCLIFIVLVYIYPLKMIFSAFFAWISDGWLPTSFFINGNEDLPNLFIIYGIGLAFVMLMFTFLYLRAMVVADQLRLNTLEKLKTKADIILYTVIAITALTSAGLAWLTPPEIGVFAGFVYWTLPFSTPFIMIYYAKKVQKLK